MIEPLPYIRIILVLVLFSMNKKYEQMRLNTFYLSSYKNRCVKISKQTITKFIHRYLPITSFTSFTFTLARPPLLLLFTVNRLSALVFTFTTCEFESGLLMPKKKNYSLGLELYLFNVYVIYYQRLE